ncbi:hypothetical protein AB0F92_34685 [Kitasatospora aureofaciens]|uniref:Uncharacterized protein n=1 Tax=Kitasatospora aureofaciens TaxID=1894 RepID=A0A1E7NFX3_KITAU|nr:hypothetical protein [Kitasatospora aureofaciens]OEV39609.1 hypothetical protein HS99_0002755 [Kitasatospora aureofaciens]UKZ10204.1 hypothetical protein BOQ63_040580 [Streptomyces viridifaciens]
MIMEKLHKAGVKSEHAYMAGLASIGLSFVSWMVSVKAEAAGVERADRWGIFVGEWAPTFFCMGLALSQYERDDNPVYANDPRVTATTT